jgi:hypothetical protein
MPLRSSAAKRWNSRLIYRHKADDRAKFLLLTLGESHAPFPADEEEIAPLEELAGEGERLRSLGADGRPAS